MKDKRSAHQVLSKADYHFWTYTSILVTKRVFYEPQLLDQIWKDRASTVPAEMIEPVKKNLLLLRNNNVSGLLVFMFPAQWTNSRQGVA
jgi:hypothetical protein